MLENIRIVLVNTSHPGNIGSVARAMKVMGLSELYLVEPKKFPNPKATELASNAHDILDNTKVVDTLNDALTDCGLVFATSARPREIAMPGVNARECAELVKGQLQQENDAQSQEEQQVAIVFGREQCGLTNEELLHCHYHVYIPTDEKYSSLNLAAAVQVVCYELRMAWQSQEPSFHKKHDELASYDDVERFYQHLEKALIDLKFLDPKIPKRHMLRLRRLFNRAQLEEMEVNVLRGILTSIEHHTS